MVPKKSWLLQATRCVLIFLFVYAAVSKLLDPFSLVATLEVSPLIGSAAHIFSIGLPITELAVAALLLLPFTTWYGFWGSLILMLLFTGYVGYMLLFAPELPCSCGGIFRWMNWKEHLFFNIAFTLLSLRGLYQYRSLIRSKQTTPSLLSQRIAQ